MNSCYERASQHLNRCQSRLPEGASDLTQRILKKFTSFKPSSFTDQEVRSFVQGQFSEAANKGGVVYRAEDGRLKQKCGGGSRTLPEGGAE